MNEPQSRLFLAIPEDIDSRRIFECMAAAIAIGDVACVLVPLPMVERDRKGVRTILDLAQNEGVAVVVEGDASLAKELGADGVHLNRFDGAFGNARTFMDDGAIVGAACGSDRHMAMSAGEAGADYVMFDPGDAEIDGESITSWWVQLFEVPCVASGSETVDAVRNRTAEGADFVVPPVGMWESVEAAEKMIKEITRFMTGEADA